MSNTTAKIREELTARQKQLCRELGEVGLAIQSLDRIETLLGSIPSQAPKLLVQEIKAATAELTAQDIPPLGELRQSYKGPEPRTRTYRQMVNEYLAGATDWLNVAAIAEATGLSQKQVQGVVSNNVNDFDRTTRFGIFCYCVKGKGFPLKLGEETPAAVPDAPATIPTAERPPVDETDEQARDRIYTFVELNGVARPAGIAHNLSIDLDRVLRLLDHGWFTRNPHGYAIAKVKEE